MRPVKPDSVNRANSSLTLWFGMFRPIAKKGASVPWKRRCGLALTRSLRSPPSPAGGRGVGGGSVMQDLGEELLRARRARRAEEILLQRVLDDLAAGHRSHAGSDIDRQCQL